MGEASDVDIEGECAGEELHISRIAERATELAAANCSSFNWKTESTIKV
jgi:hypothetical protein